MSAKNQHDPLALEVARLMVSITKPDDAFLFGSRARGDWNSRSDIDVFTIADEADDTREKYAEALEKGRAKALQIYGQPVKIDLVRYSPQAFHYYRQAPSHLAYSALKEGIRMSREPVNYHNDYPELEPNNWPDIEQRFTNYQRQILAAETLLETGLGYEEAGQHMQRCLENSLKGFLICMDFDDGQGNEWQKSHPISGLQEKMRTFDEGRELLGDKDFSFLNDYGVRIPYTGVQSPLANEAEVLENIRATAEDIMSFIENETGRQLPAYVPPGPRGRPHQG